MTARPSAPMRATSKVGGLSAAAGGCACDGLAAAVWPVGDAGPAAGIDGEAGAAAWAGAAGDADADDFGAAGDAGTDGGGAGGADRGGAAGAATDGPGAVDGDAGDGDGVGVDADGDGAAATAGMASRSSLALSSSLARQPTPSAAATTTAPIATSVITVRDISLPVVRPSTPFGVATSSCEMIPCHYDPERRRIDCKKKPRVSVPPPSSLCVFCGSRFGSDPGARDIAIRLGERLARLGIALVYGGGGVGLMGLVANAALKGGGKVVGIIPDFLLQREAGHPALTETVVVRNMHERKLQMFERSEAFVVLPGGIGTLEELFEVLSWRTLGLHTKPIVILDSGGYWEPLADLLRSIVERGFAEATHLDHLAFIRDLDQLLPAIAAMPQEVGLQKPLDRV
ncbi:MAG: TIGR00730 family Rossman fold protein [Reyranella sp.]